MIVDKKLNEIQQGIITEFGVDNEYRLSQLAHDLAGISNKKVCIIDTMVIHDYIDNINNSDVDLVILDLSHHPDFKIAPFMLTVISKPYIVLTSDFNTSQYYPFWLLASKWVSKSDSVDFTSTKKYNVSMLCHKTRILRIYALLELSKRRYFNELQLSWTHSLPNKSVTEIVDEIAVNSSNSIYHTFNNFDEGMCKFLEIYNKLPSTYTGYYSTFDNMFDIVHGMSDSYLQIVLESSPTSSGFMSEKIFKPIRGGQLFLVQGSVGTVAYLRSLGFDTFDDYIDHNRYDGEPDWAKRTELIVSVLDEIYDSIGDIYHNTVERRIRNRELLLQFTPIKWVDNILTKW